MRRFFLIIFSLLIAIQISNAQTCQNKPDSYILKCSIRAELYEREFTCINDNCSEIIYNFGDNKVLMIDFDKDKNIKIYNNIIHLSEISGNTHILKLICREPLSDSFLSFLNRKTSSLKNNTYSGQNLIIEPFTNQNYDYLSKKIENSNEPFNCYKNKVELSGNWLIQSKTKKNYCELLYNEDNSCFETKIHKTQFLVQMLKEKNKDFMNYFLLIVLGIGLALGLFGFIVHLFENKKIDKFFKPNKYKILITIIILLPVLYSWGLITNLIFFSLYQRLIVLKEILIILGISLAYLIGCIIYHYFITLSKIKNKK